MKISYRWLARHVDLGGLSPREVANDFTLHTAEVEGLEPFADVLERVLVGHVLERAKHPDADKLSVCKVDVGSGEPQQIVCGAPNVAAGQKVAVALPGTELPGDVKIKKSKIRGIESCGMICSERELGLGDEHAGIWVLPDAARVGQPVLGAAELFGAAAVEGALDWIIEIDNKSLTHRPDLWGHRGLAREIAAIRGRELVPLATELPAASVGAPYPVAIEHASCQRYFALALDGVENGRSPDWLRLLLLAVGQRPIDLCVDLSNFVMLDLAQPNHLFDRRRLSGAIEVRAARAGERFATLDGVERALDPADLLICSGGAPVALAGIMGGEASKVAADTRELLLEVASFDFARVRRSSQRLALRTDASARFEKNLAPTLVPRAAAQLVNLLRAMQPGVRIAAPPTDVGAWKDPSRSIPLRPARVRAVLGLEIADERIESILRGLELPVSRQGASWSVAIPAERATKDLSIEEDLIEEVGRIVGYAAIPEQPLVAALAPAPRDARAELVRRAQDRLAGAAGFRETLSYSFLPDELARKLGVDAEPYVQVLNPVVEGSSRVRRSVVLSLIGLIEHNLRHASQVQLFEIGKGYFPELANERGEPRELHELALVLAQPRAADRRQDQSAIARLKGVVDDLLADLGRPAERWISAAEAAQAHGLPVDLPRWVHPARNAQACAAAPAPSAGGAPRPPILMASLCELEPRVARELGIGAEVALASVWIDALLAAPEQPRVYHALPRFPVVRVDVALAAPQALPAAAIEQWIRQAGKELVRGLALFDVYTGPNVAAGHKSLGYTVELGSQARTLEEKDTQKFLERLASLASQQGAELRRA